MRKIALFISFVLVYFIAFIASSFLWSAENDKFTGTPHVVPTSHNNEIREEGNH